VARTEDRRGAYTVLVGETVRKRPLGRPRCTWDDNIKTDRHETGRDARIGLIRRQDRDMWRALVNAVINLRGSIKCG